MTMYMDQIIKQGPPPDLYKEMAAHWVEQFCVDLDAREVQLPIIEPPLTGWVREWRLCNTCDAPMAIDIDSVNGLGFQHRTCGCMLAGWDVNSVSRSTRLSIKVIKRLVKLYDVSWDGVVHFITSPK